MRLEGGNRRWFGKNPHVRYVFREEESTELPIDDEVPVEMPKPPRQRFWSRLLESFDKFFADMNDIAKNTWTLMVCCTIVNVVFIMCVTTASTIGKVVDGPLQYPAIAIPTVNITYDK